MELEKKNILILIKIGSKESRNLNKNIFYRKIFWKNDIRKKKYIYYSITFAKLKEVSLSDEENATFNLHGETISSS
jgi:hypothetical protein